MEGNPFKYTDSYGLNPATAEVGAISGTIICGPVCGVIGGAAGFGVGAWGTNEFWNWYNNENSNQNEKRPNNCPTGTQDIDSAKNKYKWDKDKLHGIKDAAHGGMGNGKSWTGITPDGTVGINEGGKWSPQGNWKDLQ